jgi:hypothetical protein
VKKSKSGKKWLFRFLKLALVLVAIYLLWFKLERAELSDFTLDIDQNRSLICLLLFGFLWLLNISLDAFAWQRIQALISHISLKKAIWQNIKCYGLAFITPLNSGELVGRYIVQEDKAHRSKAVFLTFWTHGPKLFGKTIVSLIILGIWLVNSQQISYAFLVLIPLTVALIIYYRLEKIISSFHERKFFKYPLANYLIKGEPRSKLKSLLLIVHSFRFLIFSAQLLVSLYFLKPESIQVEILFAIPLYYFISAITPTFAGLDFLIKGALSFYFFSFFSSESIVFVIASTLVWFFNMAIPSIVGLAGLNRNELARIKRKRKKP